MPLTTKNVHQVIQAVKADLELAAVGPHLFLAMIEGLRKNNLLKQPKEGQPENPFLHEDFAVTAAIYQKPSLVRVVQLVDIQRRDARLCVKLAVYEWLVGAVAELVAEQKPALLKALRQTKDVLSQQVQGLAIPYNFWDDVDIETPWVSISVGALVVTCAVAALYLPPDSDKQECPNNQVTHFLSSLSVLTGTSNPFLNLNAMYVSVLLIGLTCYTYALCKKTRGRSRNGSIPKTPVSLSVLEARQGAASDDGVATNASGGPAERPR